MEANISIIINTKSQQNKLVSTQIICRKKYIEWILFSVVLKQQGYTKSKSPSHNLATNPPNPANTTAISPWTGAAVPIPPGPGSSGNMASSVNFEQITQQQNALQEQIRQSEQNLSAQYNVSNGIILI